MYSRKKLCTSGKDSGIHSSCPAQGAAACPGISFPRSTDSQGFSQNPAGGEDFTWIPAQGQGHPAAASGLCLNPECAWAHHTQGRRFQYQLLNTSHTPCFTADIPEERKRPPLVPTGIFGDLKILSWANQTGLLNPVTQLMQTASVTPRARPQRKLQLPRPSHHISTPTLLLAGAPARPGGQRQHKENSLLQVSSSHGRG